MLWLPKSPILIQEMDKRGLLICQSCLIHGMRLSEVAYKLDVGFLEKIGEDKVSDQILDPFGALDEKLLSSDTHTTLAEQNLTTWEGLDTKGSYFVVRLCKYVRIW